MVGGEEDLVEMLPGFEEVEQVLLKDMPPPRTSDSAMSISFFVFRAIDHFLCDREEKSKYFLPLPIMPRRTQLLRAQEKSISSSSLEGVRVWEAKASCRETLRLRLVGRKARVTISSMRVANTLVLTALKEVALPARRAAERALRTSTRPAITVVYSIKRAQSR